MFSASLTHLLSNKHSRKSPKAQLLEREFDGFRSTLIMMLHVGLNPQPNSSLHPISPVTPRSVAKLTPHYCNYTSDITVGTDGYMIVEETRTTDRSYERLPSETESQQAPDFTITAESPRISTDATPTNFQGWYYGGRTTAQSIACPTTQTFSITSPYADCLDPGATAVATDCVSNVLTYDGGPTFACPEDASCYVMTVSFTSSMVERYMCAKDWYADIIYRDQTESPNSTTIDTTIPTSTTSQFASPTSTELADTTSSSTGSTSLSGGAIAGIVIGCVIAILVIAIVFFRKQISRRFKRPASEGSTEMLDSNEIFEIGHSNNASAVTGSVFNTPAVKKNDEVQEIGIGK
ncbi:hypothetical protein N7533_004429 [Penicillium manginii]|uniref:uncharacterized protein n=1 Tax=Penicillium manginii TaxID=203109 RepID=UPI002546FA57|nr:uncharacterized protein N7533_004429 [Penicillium manginii]KAJ5754886.1 hypothetical protein N7533_004429 [Penicillium manginii]